MRDHVLLYVNGRRHEVRGSAVYQPLTDLLRDGLGLCGTKVVCAEGDCGACTVLVGRPAGDRMVYTGVDGCIQYLWQLDGRSVVTVEGLQEGAALHPAQRAMVDHHGSQCGYCTPGFVMALAMLREEGVGADRDALRLGLSGNLCRCTGYVSIVEAALAQAEADARPIAERYADPAMLAALADAALTGASIVWQDGERYTTVAIPATLEQAVQWRAAHPGCAVIAGGTDLSVQMNKGRAAPDQVLSLAHVDVLRGIEVNADHLRLGALATWRDLERILPAAFPEAHELVTLFASPQIRNAGTLAGNLVNASPIGDGLPLLLAMDAEVELASMTATSGSTAVLTTRRLPVAQFFLGYRQTALAPDELVTTILLPTPAPGERVWLRKVSRRLDMDISTVMGAFRLRTAPDGTILDARVAFGGVAATPLRLLPVEQQLVGRPLSHATLAQAGLAAEALVQPISDVRGSAGYRSRLVRNLISQLGHALGLAAEA